MLVITPSIEQLELIVTLLLVPVIFSETNVAITVSSNAFTHWNLPVCAFWSVIILAAE